MHVSVTVNHDTRCIHPFNASFASPMDMTSSSPVCIPHHDIQQMRSILLSFLPSYYRGAVRDAAQRKHRYADNHRYSVRQPCHHLLNATHTQLQCSAIACVCRVVRRRNKMRPCTFLIDSYLFPEQLLLIESMHKNKNGSAGAWSWDAATSLNSASSLAEVIQYASAHCLTQIVHLAYFFLVLFEVHSFLFKESCGLPLSYNLILL